MLNKAYQVEKVLIGRLLYNSDLIGELNAFCIKNKIRTGWISVIGAVKSVKLGYYNQIEKKYLTLEFDKSFEILSCTGNISIKDGNSFVHLHMVISDEQGKTFGGHAMPGTIVFAGEFLIQAFKGEDLVREFDEKTGLPLWKF